MTNNPNEPRIDDAVLGGTTPAPAGSVVLGGLEGVKRRLASAFVEQRKAALVEALKYGTAWLELAIAALNDESEQVSHTAYLLLRKEDNPKIKQTLNIYFAQKILRDYRNGERNFINADLSEADLFEANLSGANLHRADLIGADLSHADLSGANLSGADLDADLWDADLRGADLRGVDLCAANLSGANLSGVDLSDADLSDADLSDADLDTADLRGANLCWADLRGANLRGANLRGATVHESAYHELYGVDLSEVVWIL